MKTDISITVEWQGGRKGLKTISRVVRSRAGLWIKNHVQERVSKRGMGASGALKGYSKKPIYMDGPGSPPRMKPIVSHPSNRVVSSHPLSKSAENRGSRKRGRPNTRKMGAEYPGGYKQYKKETGQVSNKFTMTNRGHFWRDWKVLQGKNKSTGIVEIGWSRAENAHVADKAYEAGRSDMFDLNRSEIDDLSEEIHVALQQAIAKMLVGRKRKI